MENGRRYKTTELTEKLSVSSKESKKKGRDIGRWK